MGRVSQAQAQENRQRVIAEAGRLFRERGVDAVSVADVMAAAGLTHGGFYKQFASKEALVAEAVEAAFNQQQADRMNTDRASFLDAYLSPRHRDHPGLGCPAAGLASDVAHEGPDGPAREPFAEAIERYARWLAGGDGEDLATLSLLVGALTLARATAGTPVSDRILAAARESVHL
jgi:TetR/AcrR family transcriptional repressor of nem operon